MTTLLCLGFGYCAEAVVRVAGARFSRVVGTRRSADKLAGLAAKGVEGRVFAGPADTGGLADAIATAEAVLVSAAPAGGRDPFLDALGPMLATAPSLRSIVYLSTLGVYGDHGGAWIDETTKPTPLSERSRERLAAEEAWTALGRSRGTPVALLRLAGIYGPGQNALVSVARGTARPIDKLGQVFNRIHVDDIALAIEASITRRFDGPVNVSDDLPSPPRDPIVEAARLLGVPAPADVPWDAVRLELSPMAASFYAECKRASNARLKRELGVVLRYPTFREGLAALAASGEGR